jgi:2',3'-cyclic-nucleotide 2'-phosphodiesterase (5'-nucleotidase family)
MSTPIKRTLWVASLFLCFQSAFSQIKIQIIQINDVYEIAGLNEGKIGNLARVATLEKRVAAKGPTLMVMSGDFVSPSVLNKVPYEGENMEGRQMVDIMNKIGVDMVCFGNHEFDIKEKFLLKRIDESQFDWISTNADHLVNGDTVPFTRKNQPLPQRYFRSFSNGKDSCTIGFFGIVLPFNKAAYVAYSDPSAQAIGATDELVKNADVIIGITHQSRQDDSLLAAKDLRIDMLLGGHEHEWMKFKSGNAVVTKADANAKTAWVHTLKWNSKSEKLKIKSKLIPIIENLTPDPEVDKAVQGWMQAGFEQLATQGFNPTKVLITTPVPLDGREGSIRNGSTTLTKLIADACQWFSPASDAVIYNAGSIRVDDILTGTVTEYDVLRTLPFGGGMLDVSISGADLKKTLTIGTTTNIGIGSYLQFSNITHVNGVWNLKGNPIEDAKTYKVLMPNFLATVGDANLGFLTTMLNAQPTGTQPNVVNDIRNIVIAYLGTQPVIK